MPIRVTVEVNADMPRIYKITNVGEVIGTPAPSPNAVYAHADGSGEPTGVFNYKVVQKFKGDTVVRFFRHQRDEGLERCISKALRCFS